MVSIILKWLEKEEVEILIYNILVVEDDEDIIKLLKIYLEGDDYRVISAENGIDALKIIENIKVDLVILNEEKKTYENYVLEEIQNAILDANLGFMQNVNGGIFVLNQLDAKETQFLEYRANLILRANLGEIERQINDFEEEYLSKLKNIGNDPSHQVFEEDEVTRKNINDEKMLYNNGYGGFSKDGKEYHIFVNKYNRTPTVWSHILANKKFGTVTTENMGGYTWYKNSRLNRLSAWNNKCTIRSNLF